jgi:ATP synthase protein I
VTRSFRDEQRRGNPEEEVFHDIPFFCLVSEPISCPRARYTLRTRHGLRIITALLQSVTHAVTAASGAMARITSQAARPASRQSPGWQDTASDEEEVATPLTAEQARQWRARHPRLPLTRVLLMQAVTGSVAMAMAWLLTGRLAVAWSAGYGALAGVLPAALAAKGMARWAAPGFPPGAALAGFLLWEAVKLILAVGMLMAAPKILGAPNWPALLIGLALTIKVYWVGLVLRPVNIET